MDLYQVWIESIEVEVKPGRYWVGDPCYVIDEDRWMELVESANYFMSSVVGVLDDLMVLSFGTKYGDGVYFGNNGFEFVVDAGMIGLVPEKLVQRENTALGVFVDFDRPTRCSREEDGTLIFGDLVIQTGDMDYDDEDDYDDDDDSFHRH